MNSGAVKNRLVIITGGIACGKSTVSQFLAKKLQTDCLFDADKTAHHLLTEPDLIDILHSVFGDAVLDADAAEGLGGISSKQNQKRSINRSQLRKIVFEGAHHSDEPEKLEKLKKLEAILHPLVYQRFFQFLEESQSKDPQYLLAEIALFYESGNYHQDLMVKYHPTIISISCSRAEQLRRLAERGWSRAVAESAIDSQMSLSQKDQRADYVICNDGSQDLLVEQLECLATVLAPDLVA